MALTATQQSKLKAAGYKAAEIKAFGTAGLTTDQVKKLIAKKAGAAAPAKKAAAKRLVKPAAKEPAAAPARPRVKARVVVTSPEVVDVQPAASNDPPRGTMGWVLAHFETAGASERASLQAAVYPIMVASARAGGATLDPGAEISVEGKRFNDPMAKLIDERVAANLGSWADGNYFSVRVRTDHGVWETAVHPNDFWSSTYAAVTAATQDAGTTGGNGQPAADVNFADVGTQSQQALYGRHTADPFTSQIDAFARYQGAELRSVATVDKITTAVESQFGVHIDWPTNATGAARGRVVGQTKGKRPGSDLQIHSIHRVVVVKTDRSAAISGGDDVTILSTTTGKDLAEALVAICKRATGQN